MDNAFILPKSKSAFSALFGASWIAWSALSIVSPTHTANYDFRHFEQDEGLTISISKSAPPLAAILDEQLPVILTEPLIEAKVPAGSRKLAAGETNIWPKLQKIAANFEHKKAKLAAIENRRFSRKVVGAKISKIQIRKLADLVVHVPAPKLRVVERAPRIENEIIRVAAAPSQSVYDAANSMVQSSPSHQTSYSQEANLNLFRALDQIANERQGRLTVVVPPAGASSSGDGVTSGTTKTNGSVGYLVLPQAPAPAAPMVKAPPAPAPQAKGNQPGRPARDNAAPIPRSGKTASRDLIADNSNYVEESVAAVELMKAQAQPKAESTQELAVQLKGQVQLVGGLALTENHRLTVIYKTAQENREASVDPKTGEFSVEVLSAKAGKLMATLSDDAGRVLGSGVQDLADQPPGDKLVVYVEPAESLISGRVLSAYSVDGAVITVPGVEVFAPTGVREAADKNGGYKLNGLNGRSQMVLTAYAPENWGTQILANGSKRSFIPMFSYKMMESFFNIIGEPTNNTEVGVVWGEIKKHGKGVAGAEVQLSTPDAIGPIYFNELRIPDKRLKETSKNGLFAFVKVKPGLHVVMSQYKKHDLPSSVVNVSPAMVSYSEIRFKAQEIRGKVIDATTNQTIRAQVGVVGSAATVVAGQEGFSTKIPLSDAVAFVEAKVDEDYYKTRQAATPAELKDLNLFAFKKSWVASQLSKVSIHQEENLGLAIGYVTGGDYRVMLDGRTDTDYSEKNILYFNQSLQIDQAKTSSGDGGGAFIMVNLKPGMHTLVISSSDGLTNITQLLVTEAGVVNFISQ